MTPNVKIIVGIVAVVVVATGIGLWAVNKNSTSSPAPVTVTTTTTPTASTTPSTTTPAATAPSASTSTTTTTTTSPATTSPSTSTPVAATTITYKNGAFSPSSVTIAVGGSVMFTNADSSNSVNVASNPHPSHTDYPPLNIGIISPGQSSAPLTFSAAGTHGYHNHLNQTEGGTIVVK